MRIVSSPNTSYALANVVAVASRDFPPNEPYIIVNERFVFTIKPSELNSGELGLTQVQRKWADLSLGQEVNARTFNPFSLGSNVYISTMEIQVGFFSKTEDYKEFIDVEEISSIFIRNFEGQIFSVGQPMVFEFRGIKLEAIIISLFTVDQESLRSGKVDSSRGPQQSLGMLMPQTSVTIGKLGSSKIKLKGGKRVAAPLIKANFKFEDLGIGGLDDEFSAIFRRAFASRTFPQSIVERLGIQHVKGLLLYGPPGTGKTLLARQIGKMLNSHEPLIVNGPEILNKYVGQSEENVRKLFGPAEQEYQQRGEESQLHIIVFDELDAICRQRGSRNDGTGVGDSIVNQLLSKMDGVNQLNNILIIGMTNRMDMIDEALLRPGRLEIHMEIGLPDETGRVQILKVHTSTMAKNGMLDRDVDLAELAQATKNYSGAEIAGLVKAASSFAFGRHVEVGTLATLKQDYENIKVCREDFLQALDEVKAAFGVSDMELKQCVTNGVIKFNSDIERIINDGKLFIEQVRTSKRTPYVTALIHGPPNSGKTALAASIAMSSNFPFIKLVSPETMVGMSETAKMNAISKVFADAYKSPFSVIIIDSIERLIEYVSIGPRFSNAVLQTLLVLLKKSPPKGKRLLVIGTTSQRSVLEQMEATDAFNVAIHVPNITDFQSLDAVLHEMQVFSDRDRRTAIGAIKAAYQPDERGGGPYFSIGIKRLVMMVETARQDEDKVYKLVSSIGDEGNVGTKAVLALSSLRERDG
ncbi:P-loop containing nucleoside triphosphate hydrolase protein [Cladochytrium replicatum]|nr:P-loop containing nucleoside triphosphate hydrolase protein [Cladochytrium replicatum]